MRSTRDDMDLRYLALRDIGPFRGLHQFDFHNKSGKTGFAVFSKNGRGKTSIFNAMQWCLFGEVRERGSARGGRWSEGTKRPIVGDKGQPLMNESAYEQDDIPEMSVTMVAYYRGKDVQISRTAKSRVGSMPRHDEALTESLLVKIGDSTERGSRAQEIIEEMFPSELRRFFFIDGESLEEYVNLVKVGQVGGIKDDVEAVLRIPALTRGIDDLEAIRRDVWDEVDREMKQARKKTREAKKAIEVQISIEAMKEELSEKRESFEKMKAVLESVEEELSGLEEATEQIEKIRDLRSRSEVLRTSLNRSSEARRRAASDSWKILIWKRAEESHSQMNEMMSTLLNRDFIIERRKKDLGRLEKELSEWTGICSHCNQPIQNADSHKKNIEGKKRLVESELEELGGVSGLPMSEVSARLGDLSKLSPPHGSMEVVVEADNNWNEDRGTLQNIMESLQKEEGRGLVDIDQEELAKKWEKKGRLGTAIRLQRPRINELEQKIKLARREYKKFGGAERGSRDTSKDNVKVVIGSLLSILRGSVSEYRENARKEVEKIASESFVKVINAPEALTGVIIDENFNGRIKGSDGKPIKAPSSGQEMTMTLCIIDALRQASGIEAPIFFDTPGRSLDAEHKKSQLEYFWKLRDHQFVIFPHSGEYKVEETIEEFGGQIGGAWELLWPVDYDECPECGVADPLKSGGEKKCMSCNHSWDITIKTTEVRKLEVPA